MARAYKKTKRAAQQDETRQRIVEATVALHTEQGPAETTISQIADRAGVQRHTVYAHFPDELSLHMACSGLAMERDPMPDPAICAACAPGELRLKQAFEALYAWYSRNAQLMASVLRDAERHETTQQVMAVRAAPTMKAYEDILGEGRSRAERALIHAALGYFTWRALTREGGLSDNEAAAAMAGAVTCAARSESR